MENKKVSILMGIYNGEAYLEEALESILDQTYTNWECIVIDDCSTDKTPEILKTYIQRDRRFRCYRNEENQKLPGSLNRAIKEAEGTYFVRMDADDVCRRDRIEKQVEYMEKHPELDLSCGRCFIWDQDGILPTNMQRRGDADAAGALFLFFNPILHPGVIAKGEVMRSFLYDPRFTCTEDFELWIRMLIAGKKIGVQEDFLMIYRIHGQQVTVTKRELQKIQYQKSIEKFYRHFLFELNSRELQFLTEGIYLRDDCDFERCVSFLKKVIAENKKHKRMKPKAVLYAVIEVIAAYSGEGKISGKQRLKTTFAFSPFYAGAELFRRKAAFLKSLRLCENAAEKFGLKQKKVKRADRVPVYEFDL